MRNCIYLSLMLFTASCGTYDAAKTVIIEKKAAVNDEVLDSTVLVLCNDVSVGAVRRKWDGDFTKWAEFCAGNEITVPQNDINDN